MTDKVQTHSLERTSPKGGPFIGRCRLCGKQGLTFADMGEPCQNPRGLTADEALIDAVKGD
jgi:hypothetical protein